MRKLTKIIFLLLFLQCSRFHYNYKIIKTLNFERLGNISAIGSSDLNGNGTKELIISLSSQSGDAAYFYIYEWENNNLKYLWRSEPLGIIRENRYIPEIIEHIFETIQTNILALKELDKNISSRMVIASGKDAIYYIAYNLKKKNYNLLRKDEIGTITMPRDVRLNIESLKNCRIVGYKIVDLNNDGNLELICAGYFKKSKFDDDETSYQGIKIYKYRNNTIKELWQSNLINFISSLEVGDINNDKKYEIIAGNYSGNLFIFSL